MVQAAPGVNSLGYRFAAAYVGAGGRRAWYPRSSASPLPYRLTIRSLPTRRFAQILEPRSSSRGRQWLALLVATPPSLLHRHFKLCGKLRDRAHTPACALRGWRTYQWLLPPRHGRTGRQCRFRFLPFADEAGSHAAISAMRKLWRAPCAMPWKQTPSKSPTLKNRTTNDLLSLQQQFECGAKRHEDTQRFAAIVPGKRR